MRPRPWLAGFVVLAGCAAPRESFTANTAPEYMIIRQASFFRHGPAQSGRPEKLAPQTVVRLMRKESGYCVVQLADGRNGYIAGDELKVAPPRGRAVTGDELYPERLAPPLPEPDFSQPVEEVPVASAANTTAP